MIDVILCRCYAAQDLVWACFPWFVSFGAYTMGYNCDAAAQLRIGKRSYNIS